MSNPRQMAFLALRDIYQRGAFTDIALDRVLRTAQLSDVDRRLATELVYGTVRRSRTLDALIDQLGKKKAHQQPPDLRIILHLGLYQLRYQERIPVSAAVNTTVELAKENGFKGLAGVVNGLLRNYARLQKDELTEDSSLIPNPGRDPLKLPVEPVQRLGILHSFPDWIIQMWIEQLGVEETEQLCQWLNRSPTLDLRVNPLRVSIEEVETAMQEAGVEVQRVPYLPQALRLTGSTGAIQKLPGFSEGWWTIQDSSAQLVSHLLDPQSGEVAIDATAAPGGKTTHMAELMGDRGKVWACDKSTPRLKKVQENAQRLQLQSIQICGGDSRNLPQFINCADRVLLDAPCSGLGTLHRRPDIRWRTTPATVAELSVLQGELLLQAATWVKPGGILVYATCTLHPQENEGVIQGFLMHHPHWQIDPPPPNSPLTAFCTPQGWLKVWPHRYQMDGFFMARLQHRGDTPSPFP
ncbi:MAG TPA: 16S rRNA (cytosine(967)-C(5))-methyltransferase [Cyanobacteria bacterium UBA8803]|nr:16S rRNA (cytosine(967)-C(5))-methyltransferase [Cyanobacteria bacterium UBA9273]HBL61287.1 16S rRNA (cytosine(967)-C(5))-methyltransferase [Cyanobacteria bacterium UBA8803]